MPQRKRKPLPLDSRTALFWSIINLLINKGRQSHKDIAQSAEISPSTIHNWCYGTVTRPRIDTLTKVAGALGYEIVLKKPRRKRNG